MRRLGSIILRFLVFVALATLAGCDPGGAPTPDLVWGIHGRKPGWLVKPRAAAFDRDDHLYLVDLTDRVQVFDREGKYLRGWQMPDFNVDGPSGVSIDRNGRLLVADTHFYRVLVFSPEGKILLQIGDGVQGTTPGRFGYPCDVVCDRLGNFYVADYGENDRIQVFSPQGKWLRQWGGHGYEPGQFVRPRALAIDDQDRIYVADSVANRIQVFDTAGQAPLDSGARGARVRAKWLIPTTWRSGLTARSTSASTAITGSRNSQPDGTSLGVWGESGRGPGQLVQPLGPGGRQPGRGLGRRLEQSSDPAVPALNRGGLQAWADFWKDVTGGDR